MEARMEYRLDEDRQSRQGSAAPRPWKVLIADDDEDVHAATQLALRDVEFRGRGVEFVHAFSAAETLEQLVAHPDTAVIFLDVIMETDDAGLGAARKIREQGFKLVRLIVRTGHPGQAPERDVIVNYDIHDYKEKVGLSAKKLFTSLISALRAYDDLVALENHRRGLMCVLDSVSWFDFDDVQRYLDGMLLEFSTLAHLGGCPLLIAARPAAGVEAEIRVIACAGVWSPGGGDAQSLAAYPVFAADDVRDCFAAAAPLARERGVALFLARHGVELVAYGGGSDAFADADRVLLEVFLDKVCQALANHRAFQSISGERDALLLGLAQAAENWNPDAERELCRLAELSEAIADRLEMTLAFPDEIDSHFRHDIGVAARLHDIGNLTLPLDLLTKTEAISGAERERLHAHVVTGLRILQPARAVADQRGVLALACDVIAGHHERYDGSGYPAALAGTAIPLAGRLVAVADAYVAMTSSRPWRQARSPQQAVAWIADAAGKAFDPVIVEAFRQVVGDAAD